MKHPLLARKSRRGWPVQALVLTDALVPKSARLPQAGPADEEVIGCRGAYIFGLFCSALSLNLISSVYVEEFWRWLGGLAALLVRIAWMAF